jgi:phosphomevalonate kinase
LFCFSVFSSAIQAEAHACIVDSSAQDKLTPNPFIETTLSFVLSYISSISTPVIEPAAITILADDDYYTQPSLDQVTSFKGEQFKDFGVSLSEAHKTGLGSSAALVTALTGALLTHYLPNEAFSLSTTKGKARLHNLAQTAHCAAQGKVGSGFDVASAVYGSCVYRRFSPSLLAHHGAPGSAGFTSRLGQLIDETGGTQWDTEISKAAVGVPSGVRMVMADVDCGSQTPGMVKQVLGWRAREPEEAGMLWAGLHARNQALAAELRKLADSAAGNGSKDYSALSKAIEEVRALVRDMSRLSGVPIEPAAQTGLLDACSEVDGVIGGVVPGAGGFDAVALLIEDNDETMERLKTRLDEWNKQQSQSDVVDMASGKDSTTKHGRVSLLRVRAEDEGIRSEDPTKYESWIG